MTHAPVITIDGTSGTGKGTLSHALAIRLGWGWLDSGAIYRCIAWAALEHQIPLDDPQALVAMIKRCCLMVGSRLEAGQLKSYAMCDGLELGDLIRTESCAKAASAFAAFPEVRAAVLDMQRDARREPGLVTDGRDMGTVVFPDADLKFFMSASAEERAERRYNQLQEQGEHVSLRAVLDDIEARDSRDEQRDVSPLVAAPDAILLDTAGKSIPEVFAEAWRHVQQAFPNALGSE